MCIHTATLYCSGENRKFFQDVPNAYLLPGAIVGGPNLTDMFTDLREAYEFTEVALDYNTAFTIALAATAAAPPALAAKWNTACSKLVPKYPWAEAVKVCISANGL
jgi:hypothetical protein